MKIVFLIVIQLMISITQSLYAAAVPPVSTESPHQELLKTTAGELLGKLPIDVIAGSSNIENYSFYALPRWMPFSSFSIARHIFINAYKQTPNQIKDSLGHELWHAYYHDTYKQVGYAALYGTMFIIGYKLVEKYLSKPIQSYRFGKLATALAAYATYALFHKQCVRPMELEATLGNATMLGNYEIIMKNLTDEHQAEALQPYSLGRLIFTLIAPFHPAAHEFQQYIKENCTST